MNQKKGTRVPPGDQEVWDKKLHHGPKAGPGIFRILVLELPARSFSSLCGLAALSPMKRPDEV